MRRVQVMGIVNVTPDSFSDGGQFFRPEEALRRARNLIDEGADIIDLGGESTRPGATPLGWQEEWSRLEPVLSGLEHLNLTPLVSVDTYHPETAERAIAAGADIINCVYPEPIPALLKLLDRNPSVELVLPCRLANLPNKCGRDKRVPPSTLPNFPNHPNLPNLPNHPNHPNLPNLQTLISYLPRLYLDPMIGFDTTREQDVELLRSIPELAKHGRVLVGASRKRIVKKLTGEKMTGKNLGGNLGIAVWAAMNGACVVRVHDVKETVQALRVVEALGNV